MLLLILAFLLQIVIAAPPALINSSYQIREGTVNGLTIQYALLELDFDQPLHLATNWVCPCSVGGVSCPAVPSKYYPPVTPLIVTDVTENTWVTNTIVWGEVLLLRINVQPSGSLACPNLELIVNGEYGSVAMSVANDFIPSYGNGTWSKVPYNQDRIKICNTDNRFAFGYYYLSFRIAPPFQANARFAFQWKTSGGDICTPAYNGTPISNQLLLDGEAVEGTISGYQKDYFEFQIDALCANFSVSLRKSSQVAVAAGEVDLFISFSDDRPNVYSFDYMSAIEGDDSVTVLNFCTDSQPIIMFIGVEGYGSDLDYNYSIVATAKYGFDLIPLTQFNLIQSQFSLSSQVFRVTCGSQQDEQLTCNFPNPSGDVYGSVYAYCFPTFPVGAIEDPNPMFPHIGGDDLYLSYLRALYWNANDTYHPVVYPNRLVIAIELQRYSTVFNDYRNTILNYNNVDSCTVSFFNKLSNANFEPINGVFLNSTYYTLDFTSAYPTRFQAAQACTPDMVDAIIARRDSLLQIQAASNDINTLQKTQLQLVFLHMSSNWTNCQVYVNSFFTQISAPAVLPDIHLCDAPYDVLSYSLFTYSSCCGIWNTEYRYAIDDCCLLTNQSIPASIANQSREDAFDGCITPECLAILAAAYIDKSNAVSSCDDIFLNSASPDVISSLVTFIYDCQLLTLGAGLVGRDCVADSDCFYGASCVDVVPSGRTCNNTNADVLQCFADFIDPVVGQFVFDLLQIPEAFNKTVFVSQMSTLFVVPDCAGPDSIYFRERWELASNTPTCSDPASTCSPGKDPACFDYRDGCTALCFNDICARSWVQLPGNVSGCTEEGYCNWMDCAGLDQAQCQAACLNASLPAQTCIQCQSGQCVELTGLSQAQCESGICDLDPTVFDKAACEAIQSCSSDLSEELYDLDPDPITNCSYLGVFCTYPQVSCGSVPVAANEASCPSAGVCSSYCELNNYMETYNTSGVCFSPKYAYPGFPYIFVCEDNYPTQWIPFTEGCPQSAYLNESSCRAANSSFWWRSIATTQAECESVQMCAQNLNSTGFLSALPNGTCQSCSPLNSFQSIYTWTPASFRKGRLQTLRWVSRSFSPKRWLAPVVDFVGFKKLVASAIASKNALEYSSYEICKWDDFSTFLNTLSCDCNQPNRTDDTSCFVNQNPSLKRFKACSFLQTDVVTYDANITFYNTSVNPQDYCLDVNLILTPAELFTVDIGQRLSSEIFYAQPQNFYSVVTDIGLLRGQIVSHGIKVTWNTTEQLLSPATLCIIQDASIPVDSKFTQLAFGVLGYKTVYMSSSPYNVTVYGNVTVVCGQVPAPGTYFAIIVDANFDAVRNGHLAQCIISSVFYFIALLFAIYYMGCFFFYYNKNRLYFKCFLSVVITFFCAIRAVYWILVAFGTFYTINVVSYILFELPTYFFLVMFSCIIYLWADFCYRGMNMKKTISGNEFSWLLYIFFIWSVFLLIVVTFFMCLYYIIPSGVVTLPCQTEQRVAGGTRTTVSTFYVICIGIFGLILALVGVLVAYYFNSTLLAIRQRANNDDTKMKKTVQLYYALIVGVVFAFCFLLKSGIFIGFVINTSIVFPIIVFSFLELMATFALLFYISPARTPLQHVSLRDLTGGWSTTLTNPLSSFSNRSSKGSGMDSSDSVQLGSMNSSHGSSISLGSESYDRC